MKEKLLDSVREFVDLCYTFGKIGPAEFAEKNFPNIIKNFWENGKTDEENLKSVKNMFIVNKELNEKSDNKAAATVISSFIDGWLNKL